MTRLDHDLAAGLRAKGHRVTAQRLVLHRALRELGRHATADEVLHAAGDRLPGLALPTVYATLELFEQLGLVRRVSAGGAARFDPRTDDHPHFRCRVCGGVRDLDAEVDASAALHAARAAGLQPAESSLVVVGRCDACAEAA